MNGGIKKNENKNMSFNKETLKIKSKRLTKLNSNTMENL